MSILIKGVEMPENCALCPMWDAGNCLAAAEAIICEYNKRPSDCPLVPVPPHGRCVDADKLMQEMCLFIKENMLSRDDARELLETIKDAPTVIEAEEGE